VPSTAAPCTAGGTHTYIQGCAWWQAHKPLPLEMKPAGARRSKPATHCSAPVLAVRVIMPHPLALPTCLQLAGSCCRDSRHTAEPQRHGPVAGRGTCPICGSCEQSEMLDMCSQRRKRCQQVCPPTVSPPPTHPPPTGSPPPTHPPSLTRLPAPHLDLQVLLLQGQGLPRRHPQLPLHQVNATDRLGHWVLHLHRGTLTSARVWDGRCYVEGEKGAGAGRQAGRQAGCKGCIYRQMRCRLRKQAADPSNHPLPPHRSSHTCRRVFISIK
jgi:hypothetical protein